jgi:hypothetical protein
MPRWAFFVIVVFVVAQIFEIVVFFVVQRDRGRCPPKLVN